MSAILGVFHDAPRAIDGGPVTRMLDRMQARGHQPSEVWSVNGAALGVARQQWELQDDFSGNVCVVDEGDLVIAADASVYYREDLGTKLGARGVRIGGKTASHLILAAFRAWGDQCVAHLEGDYAFIVYDRRRPRVFAARDLGGKRPLHYAHLDHVLVLASTAGAVAAHPACPRDLNVVHLAEVAAALWSSPNETTYQAVSLLPPGSSLRWTPGQEPRVQQDWHPPEAESGTGPAFEDAAVELRALLQRATDERLASQGTTAVWMSGGWDSTAVFGAGQAVLRGGGTARDLRPVSISYPPGDPGHEDEFIVAVAERFAAPVHWLKIGDIPLLDRPAEGAARRDEPGAHVYEHLTRALARGCRALGARVALDGNGGDQLFQVSPVYLADLLRAGRWSTFARERQALNLGGLRNLFSWGVKPWLPPRVLDAATFIRGGRRLHGVYDRWMPSWISPRLAKTLRERQEMHLPPRDGRTCHGYEAHLYLTASFLDRVFGLLFGLVLDEGVELRSPLYDQRVLEFAARRPREERCSAGETKLLLRRAMQDLLPEEVLAPRRFRTGVASGYFTRQTRQRLPTLFAAANAPWALAELGLVEPPALQRGLDEYLGTLDPDIGLALLCTLQAELWLQARQHSNEPPGDTALAPVEAFRASPGRAAWDLAVQA